MTSLKKMRENLAAEVRGMEAHLVSIRIENRGRSNTAQEEEGLTNLRKMLGQVDSAIIEQQAERWGIELPSKPAWYDFDIEPELGPDKIYRWLNPEGIRMMSKQIKEARFAYWKGLADLLIPILALAVAFLALFKDIIVELLKRP